MLLFYKHSSWQYQVSILDYTCNQCGEIQFESIYIADYAASVNRVHANTSYLCY